ncbi:hypothetical protein POM88_049551 [Heracleum sosnowskyi]|uniref:Disease resistance protein At4g27190-like leucine-rich repeats domain-containing protein n=1 Tax=Heracleum sosnowskyi TaxID=360622 RepID=A0AAD8GY15_9APIA|nr:hypothetical protein POM88_049550 [Heracleum sosnowskyi]KAK1356295.1 hypothetical protein POM88_049551 [Heracleum sosnowskyi]
MLFQLGTPTLDATGLIYASQTPREYAHGSQRDWLHMQQEKVRISSCGMMTEIIGEGDQFPSLVDFKLDSCGVINLEAIELYRDDSTCPLESIYMSNNEQMQLPCFGSLKQLQRLDVSDCDLLKEIVEDVRSDEHAETDMKTIVLLQLHSVVFKDLPNLKSFTHGANYECHMPALKKMEFDNCGLSSLFTCSVFRNLQQLDELVVSNCRLLEAIVEDGRGNGEISDTNDKIISYTRTSYQLFLKICHTSVVSVAVKAMLSKCPS